MYANESAKTAEPKKLGSVESAASDLENTIARVSGLVSCLADRLSPVLRPQDAACGRPCAPDYNAPFAQTLQASDRTLGCVEDAVRDLLDRLEI